MVLNAMPLYEHKDSLHNDIILSMCVCVYMHIDTCIPKSYWLCYEKKTSSPYLNSPLLSAALAVGIDS